ncbi:hypothetical protein K491DRAFT_784737 [Lophiostoma macrostomum CBS 122681]|uniref:AAA+ ATPase domain-containing protein n=1 Tax=Lophiostoma macrostomum CBS 122681 TaxID=1314788 RepID=A0A6A6SJ50_9PLEO|nr:hypothetical protein K491DRAFT_784737 [Lophiostoma macrostomum CBS 122681]
MASSGEIMATESNVVREASAANPNDHQELRLVVDYQAAKPSPQAEARGIINASSWENREVMPSRVCSEEEKSDDGDRIGALEYKVRMMEYKHDALRYRFKSFRENVMGAPEKADLDAIEPEVPNSRLIVCRMNPQFWKNFSEAPYQSEVYPIDVLIGDPELPKAKKKWSQHAWVEMDKNEDEQRELHRETGPTSEDSDAKAQHELTNMRGETMPERIRLSLFAVQYLFRRLLDVETGIPHHYCSTGVILLRPYKPLFLEQCNIRSRLAWFHELLDSLERSGNDVNHNNREADTDAQSGCKIPRDLRVLQMHDLTSMLSKLDLSCCDSCSERLLNDFATVQWAKLIIQCLLEFITDYADPVHQRHRRRSLARIAFCDLWHLFKPGDEVMLKTKDTPDDELSWHTSLFRVLRVQGGRPHIYSREDAPNLRGFHPPPPPPEKPSPPQGTLTKEPSPPPRPRAVNGIIPFTVDAYYLDFNGHRLTPIRRRFFIESYAGEREVRELVIIPYEIVSSDYKALQKSALIARGHKFVDYVFSKTASHVECRGLELTTNDDINEQLLVDTTLFWKGNNVARPTYFVPEELDVAETNDCAIADQYCQGAHCQHMRTLILTDQYVDKYHMDEHVEQHEYLQLRSVLKPWQRPDLTDDDLALCTYRLYAWGLQSRRWVQVHVDHLSRIIQAQVHEHFRRKASLASISEQSVEFVRGKGQGLILLLHGAPGVGKTATAECIADLVQRPLYPITCGDLGSTALEVEVELSRHFDLASRWDCVMLLDEADVFLAKRSREDHGRNAIVSVFLRMLEYYKGILFLTTNRIGVFDEAFKSRIHISLFYPNFDEETTIRVWKTFIKQTQKANANRPNFRIDAKGIKTFAREHYKRSSENSRWNGRQIRNAFHTAIAMAEYEARAKQPNINVRDPLSYEKDLGDVKVELGRQQFDVISSTVRQFDDYIKETIGQSYEASMEHDKLRLSKYKSKDKDSKKSKKKTKHKTSDSSSDSSPDEKAKRKKLSKKAKEESSFNSDSE